ncbi:MAG: hypothetical protein AAFR81_07080 [Chloroflexota bacterium]
MAYDKIASFLISGELPPIYVGQSLDVLINKMGTPTSHKTIESFWRDIERTRQKTYNSDRQIVWYGAAEIYLFLEDYQLQNMKIEGYTIKHIYYQDRSLPRLLTNDGWHTVFNTLFGCSEAKLRLLLQNLSIKARKRVNRLPYLSIHIEDSDVCLHFDGDKGIGGLQKTGVDKHLYPTTEAW